MATVIESKAHTEKPCFAHLYKHSYPSFPAPASIPMLFPWGLWQCMQERPGSLLSWKSSSLTLLSVAPTPLLILKHPCLLWKHLLSLSLRGCSGIKILDGFQKPIIGLFFSEGSIRKRCQHGFRFYFITDLSIHMHMLPWVGQVAASSRGGGKKWKKETCPKESLYFPISLSLQCLISFSFPHDHLPHSVDLWCEFS